MFFKQLLLLLKNVILSLLKLKDGLIVFNNFDLQFKLFPELLGIETKGLVFTFYDFIVFYHIFDIQVVLFCHGMARFCLISTFSILYALSSNLVLSGLTYT